MDAKDLRYIIFLIDSKIKIHDGKIFASHQEAEEYAIYVLKEEYADKAVIGMFLMDPNSREMLITSVETIGFKGDKKNIDQLELFKPHSHTQ